MEDCSCVCPVCGGRRRLASAAMAPCPGRAQRQLRLLNGQDPPGPVPFTNPFFCSVGLAHNLEDEDVVQIVKKKVTEGGDEARGRFKQTGAEYVKLADREKKKPLKT